MIAHLNISGMARASRSCLWMSLILRAAARLASAGSAMKNLETSAACPAYFKGMAGTNPNDPAAGGLHFQGVNTYQH